MFTQNILLLHKNINSVTSVHKYFMKIRNQFLVRKMSTTIKVNKALLKEPSCSIAIRMRSLRKGLSINDNKSNFQKDEEVKIFPNGICKITNRVKLNSFQRNLLPLLIQYSPNQERLSLSKLNTFRVTTKLYFATAAENDRNSSKKEDTTKKLKLLLMLLIVMSAPVIYKRKRESEDKLKGDIDESNNFKIPPLSENIPEDVPFVLIGGGTASYSASRAIRTVDPKAKVLILSNENHYPYMRPPLSKELVYLKNRDLAKNFIFKQWDGSERSIFFEPDEFFIPCEDLEDSENGGLAIARGWNVVSVDPSNKIITLEDGKQITYGKCLLATGSSPRKLPIIEDVPTELLEKIIYYRSVEDYEHIDKIIDNGPKTVAIYGGGFLASELSTAIARRKGKNVNIVQIVRGETVLEKILPRYLSDWMKSKIEIHGVLFINNANLEKISKASDGKIELSLANDRQIDVDYLVVCIGSEPNTEIAENSRLEIDPNNGGIVANAELMARSDLYVAGDCASYYDPLLKMRRNIQHHDHAVISGRIAGENMTGRARTYSHQSMFWSEVGYNVSYEGVGNISSDLETIGIFASDKNSIQEVTQQHQTQSDYSKGIVFYLKGNIVQGILLWNVFHKTPLARQIIAESREFEDLNEVAKLFNIYSYENDEVEEKET